MLSRTHDAKVKPGGDIIWKRHSQALHPNSHAWFSLISQGEFYNLVVQAQNSAPVKHPHPCTYAQCTNCLVVSYKEQTHLLLPRSWLQRFLVVHLHPPAHAAIALLITSSCATATDSTTPLIAKHIFAKLNLARALLRRAML